MKILISNQEGHFYEETDNVIYILAEGAYTYFILKDKRKILYCYNLGTVHKALKDYCFERLNRSVVINLKMVTYFNRSEQYCILSIDDEDIKFFISKIALERLKNEKII